MRRPVSISPYQLRGMGARVTHSLNGRPVALNGERLPDNHPLRSLSTENTFTPVAPVLPRGINPWADGMADAALMGQVAGDRGIDPFSRMGLQAQAFWWGVLGGRPPPGIGE